MGVPEKDDTNKTIIIVIGIAVSILLIISIIEQDRKKKIYSYESKIDSKIDSSENAEREINREKINQKLRGVKVIKDEFSKEEFVVPPNYTKFVNKNVIYFYFPRKDLKATGLRIMVQYAADDWLFIEKVVFLVNDKTYEHFPYNLKRDHGGGRIAEWSDDVISNGSNMYELFDEIAKSKNVKVRFVGSQYNKDRNLTTTELSGIKKIHELYQLMK